MSKAFRISKAFRKKSRVGRAFRGHRSRRQFFAATPKNPKPFRIFRGGLYLKARPFPNAHSNAPRNYLCEEYNGVEGLRVPYVVVPKGFQNEHCGETMVGQRGIRRVLSTCVWFSTQEQASTIGRVGAVNTHSERCARGDTSDSARTFTFKKQPRHAKVEMVLSGVRLLTTAWIQIHKVSPV
jgi:hypothetical protein